VKRCAGFGAQLNSLATPASMIVHSRSRERLPI
jgi:hypothetical protein